jgi:BlaI family penicillinase repressor
MKKSKLDLSPLEWEIMEIIWDFKHNPSVRDVLDTAYPNKEKAYTTVQTVMNNLEMKGFLTKEKIGMVNFYKPTKKRKEMLNKETNHFVQRVFGGSFHNLANYLIDSDSLTSEEINDLKKLINDKEGK